VSIEEIAEVVRSHDAGIEIVRDAEAVEYRKTLAMVGALQLSTPDVLALPPADAQTQGGGGEDASSVLST
jgi:hypothetical protein